MLCRYLFYEYSLLDNIKINFVGNDRKAYTPFVQQHEDAKVIDVMKKRYKK